MINPEEHVTEMARLLIDGDGDPIKGHEFALTLRAHARRPWYVRFRDWVAALFGIKHEDRFLPRRLIKLLAIEMFARGEFTVKDIVRIESLPEIPEDLVMRLQDFYESREWTEVIPSGPFSPSLEDLDHDGAIVTKKEKIGTSILGYYYGRYPATRTTALEGSKAREQQVARAYRRDDWKDKAVIKERLLQRDQRNLQERLVETQLELQKVTDEIQELHALEKEVV